MSASGPLVVSSTLTLEPIALSYRYQASGGPGGQHANRSRTRVEVVFDIDASTSLTDAERRRLRQRFGPRVTASAGDERVQSRNRLLAERRLVNKIRDALQPVRPRRPTTISRAAKRRRMSAKQRRSTLKQNRRRPTRLGDD